MRGGFVQRKRNKWYRSSIMAAMPRGSDFSATTPVTSRRPMPKMR